MWFGLVNRKTTTSFETIDSLLLLQTVVRYHYVCVHALCVCMIVCVHDCVCACVVCMRGVHAWCACKCACMCAYMHVVCPVHVVFCMCRVSVNLTQSDPLS